MIDTKPFVESLDDKPVAVYGLGLSGFSAAKALIKSGVKVFAWDDDEERRYVAAQAGIEISSFDDLDFHHFSILVLSPGIPLHFPAPHMVVQKAREAGLEIVCDIEIFHRCKTGVKTIGITGTNGKSTTTALIHHVLTQSGVNNVMGGNIGRPVLDLNISPHKTLAVFELSSYQLDLCPSFRPDISVLLNLTPDHLDRHGSMEAYAAAKEKIFDGDGVALCSIDDEQTKNVYDRTVKAGFRRVYALSVHKTPLQGVFVHDGYLYDHLGTDEKEIGPVGNIQTLPGAHNLQNIVAAYAACKIFGLASDEILEHIKTYPGLAHRQYLTRIINGIAYVNDSKATNMDATSKALDCYNNIYLIAGGRAKEGGLSGIESFADKISHVFLIGEAMDDFARQIEKFGIAHTKSQSLDVAVLEAHKMAQSKRGEPGAAPTVLLSPACASWDQFKNFEHRGDVFTSLVNSLSEDVVQS